MGCLLGALGRGRDVLGLDRAAGGDAVFAGLKRRLPAHAKVSWRQKICAACAAHAGLGQASLVLYDVSTLYSETDEGRWVASRAARRSDGWTRESPSACSAGVLVQTPLRPHLWCYGARR